jgi:septum formation protein
LPTVTQAERPRLILASTSRYRRELLERLRLPFDVAAPDVDEAALEGEAPRGLAIRLAQAKADAVARTHPDAVVIGSDQVADLDGGALGKPGTRDRAVAQLQHCSGREVAFHTAVCVRHAASDRREVRVDLTQVRFRVLRDAEIGRYLDLEQPYDCAGSFKCEGLGACLFESIHNEDPSALIGLPLIALAQALRCFGYTLP